jgi:hypothetical protein
VAPSSDPRVPGLRLAASCRLLAFSALALGLGLAGCASHTPSQINELYREVLEQRATHYRIKPGDTLTVKFYGAGGKSDLDQELRVLADGRTDPYFLDNLVVAGLTVDELKAKLVTTYEKEVTAAIASLQVEPLAETVVIEGEVESPGVVNYFPRMTLSQLISRSGGYKITACIDSVRLKRPYLNPEHPDVFTVDLSDDSAEIFLLPEDQIWVERNLWIYARDYVREYVWGMLPPIFSSIFGGFI